MDARSPFDPYYGYPVLFQKKNGDPPQTHILVSFYRESLHDQLIFHIPQI